MAVVKDDKIVVAKSLRRAQAGRRHATRREHHVRHRVGDEGTSPPARSPRWWTLCWHDPVYQRLPGFVTNDLR